jgi:hypothetical protein
MDGTGVAAAGIILTAFVGSLAIEFGYISGRADRLPKLCSRLQISRIREADPSFGTPHVRGRPYTGPTTVDARRPRPSTADTVRVTSRRGSATAKSNRCPRTAFSAADAHR